MTRPGVRPGGRPTFFASPKKDRQKKATPMIAPRCAGSPCRRWLKRGAAKLAPLRCTQTDAAPYPLQPSPSRRAQRGPEKQPQRQRPTATATTTATASAAAATALEALAKASAPDTPPPGSTA